MKKFVINLGVRYDRYLTFKTEMDQLGFEVERFNAIYGNNGIASRLLPGEVGCRESHREIIKLAQLYNYDNVMIFEDDFEANDDFLNHFNNILNSMPVDFDFIQFGANVQGLRTPYNEYLDKCYSMFAAHCYIVSSKVYSDIICCEADLPIDVIYSMIHMRGDSYMSNKKICGQRRDFSNIQNGVVDYGFLL